MRASGIAGEEKDAQVANESRRAEKKPSLAPRWMSGLEAAGLVKFAYFTDAPPSPGTLLFTAFRRNMPPGVKEFPLDSRVTFFYGIQQVGRMLNIRVRWLNPDGDLIRSTDQPMDQTHEGALWTWQVDVLDEQEPGQPGVWLVELLISGHCVGRYPFLVRSGAAARGWAKRRRAR